MNISIKQKRSICNQFKELTKGIFSDKIYGSIVSDSNDIVLDTLLYDELFQTQSFIDVYNVFITIDFDLFLSAFDENESNWFLSKLEVFFNLKEKLTTLNDQIISGVQIDEKLLFFYKTNQQSIDTWYYTSDVLFDDNSSVEKLFISRFNKPDLINSNMRIINILFSENEDIIQVLQSYHKDKIDLFYS